MNRVLVTGGAGFIGSHTCKLIAANGWKPVVYDNLSTGHAEAVRWGPLVVGDVRDESALRAAIAEHRPDSVIHFAASAYVGESVANPGMYYDNNVNGMRVLLDCLRASGIGKIVFSSSCATYGIPETLPISETSIQSPINPYGRTKLICEQMLDDFSVANGLRFVALRYFNACGADPDGELVERHTPEPHLIPRALMAAYGFLDTLEIYGDDYPTPDGTCVRDYIHVNDLASGHLAALQYLSKGGENLRANLGTGKGLSILEILDGVERVTGKRPPAKFKPRRAGDPPSLFAEVGRAASVLDFTAKHSDLTTILSSAAVSVRKVYGVNSGE